MEYIHKFPTVHKISWARRKVSDVTANIEDPVQIFVVSKGIEDNLAGERRKSTDVNMLTIEDETHLPFSQNDGCYIADEVFGDISSFLPSNHDENEQNLPVQLTNQENELTITDAISISDDCQENEELDIEQAENLPETTYSHAEESVRTSACKDRIRRIIPSSNTDKMYKPSIHIYTHFDMMYTFGTCAYRLISQRSTDRLESKTWRAASAFQTAIFVTVVFLSTFQSFCDAKYFFLWFLAGGGLNQLVRFAFNLTNLVSCAYGAHLLYREGDAIKKMVQAINIYENKWKCKSAKPALSFILVIVTVVLASVKALFLVDFNEMSAEIIILQSSHELSEDLFLWSSSSLNSTTAQLESVFGTTLTATTILMGILKIFRNFVFALLHGMIWDIIGNIVLVMMCWMVFFMTSVHTVVQNVHEENELPENEAVQNIPEENKTAEDEAANNIPEENEVQVITSNENESEEREPVENVQDDCISEENGPAESTPVENLLDEDVQMENILPQIELDKNREKEIELQRQRIIVWKMYRRIRLVFAAVNQVFGPLLMLFHVTNVLRYAFFMERVIYPEEATTFEYVHILYDIVKSEIVYLTAKNIAKQNIVIRKWLRNWAIHTGKIDLGTMEKDITVVLDELDQEPLGLGQGDLLINQNFHFGLLGLVSSLFVMLANKTGVKL